MKESGLCSLCTKEDKTTIHIFWNCLATRDVWLYSSLPTHKWSSTMIDLWHIWDLLTEKLSAEQLSLAAHIMRSTWLRRNDFVFQDKIKNPHTTAQSAIMEYEAFRLACCSKQGEVAPLHQGRRTWMPPTKGRIKFNWDVANKLTCGKVGIRVVIRDWKVIVCVA